jgi:hypothetical protein
MVYVKLNDTYLEPKQEFYKLLIDLHRDLSNSRISYPPAPYAKNIYKT